ncbi:MAG: DUF1963 domain-containing protein [Rhodobacteraceae bacterium]|nr:DUF1963 domain-containing protein [Alphaproteobacteria bacterium]NNK66702.1 DUF1963 domain-containing protein [Paracoccaceae bacterium]
MFMSSCENLQKTHLKKPAIVLSPKDLRARVLKTCKPAYVLGRKDYTSGRNWFGGLPLLPDHMPWPRTTLHQQPMHFWAQIDCSTLSGPYDLPQKGLLLFFYDLEAYGADQKDSGLGKVIFVPPDEIPSAERIPPDDLPIFSHEPGEQTSAYGEGNVKKKFAAVPHEFASYDLENVDLNWDRLTHENEFDAREIATEMTHANRKKTIAEKAPETHGQHALLGPEQKITNPTRGDGVRLMCLGSDVEMDWEFGDVGVVEFWISPTDLCNRRFDLAYAMAGS